MNPTLAFVIPCYNEEASVGLVVAECKKAYPSAPIYVYDNNSTDQTSKRATSAGATVISVLQQGKGHVLRKAFQDLDVDFIVMLDGDSTYSLEAFPEMFEKVQSGGYDICVASRKAESNKAFPPFHVFGNRLISLMVSVLLMHRLEDALSGLRILSKKFYKGEVFRANEFEIETEMSFKSILHKYKVVEVPSPYRARPHGGRSKLKTFKDGWRIVSFLLNLELNWGKWIPYTLITIFLGLHSYAYLFKMNRWPVSFYPMFARHREVSDIGTLRVEAHMKNGEVVRIPLFTDTIMSRILMHWTMKDPGVYEAVKSNLTQDFSSDTQRTRHENVWRVKYHMVQNFRRDLKDFVDLSEVKEIRALHLGAIIDENGNFKEKVDEEFVLDISQSSF